MEEVGQNTANMSDLVNRAVQCGLDKKNLGVPLLTAGKECIIGDQNIIDWLKSKAQQ